MISHGFLWASTNRAGLREVSVRVFAFFPSEYIKSRQFCIHFVSPLLSFFFSHWHRHYIYSKCLAYKSRKPTRNIQYLPYVKVPGSLQCEICTCNESEREVIDIIKKKKTSAFLTLNFKPHIALLIKEYSTQRYFRVSQFLDGD